MGILSVAVGLLLGGCGTIPPKTQIGQAEPGSAKGEQVEITDIQEIYYTRQESYVPEISSFTLTRTEEGACVTLGSGYSEEEYVYPEDAGLLDKAKEILEKYEVGKWNGFHETDPMALDGSGFSLRVTFSDGTKISASGNNRFPENYDSFCSELGDLVAPAIEQWQSEQQ